MKKLKVIGLMMVMIFSVSLVGCQNQKRDKKIIVAEQYGLAYAPIQIMKEKGYLEEAFPDHDIEWVKLGNASAIREAMLSRDLDVGFMGIPPYIIGYDQQTPWRIFTGLSEAPLGLVSSNPSIQSLEDIKETDQIILPQPGSIQHILLQMASKKAFKKVDRFDHQLLSMNHADGLSALVSNDEISLQFTSPPYLFEALKNKNHQMILSGQEAFGGSFTFIVGVGREGFLKNPGNKEGFLKAINKSIHFINDQREESLSILRKSYNLEEEDLKTYLYDAGILYKNQLSGVEKFSNFMHASDMIDEAYTLEDLIWMDQDDE